METLKDIILETIDIFETKTKKKKQVQDANTTVFNEIMTMFGCVAAINKNNEIALDDKNISFKTPNHDTFVELANYVKKNIPELKNLNVDSFLKNKKWNATYKLTGTSLADFLKANPKWDFGGKSIYKFIHPKMNNRTADDIWNAVQDFISKGQSCGIFVQGNYNNVYPADIILYNDSNAPDIKKKLNSVFETVTDTKNEKILDYYTLWQVFYELYEDGDLIGISLKKASDLKSMTVIEQNFSRFKHVADGVSGQDKIEEKLDTVFTDPIEITSTNRNFDISRKVTRKNKTDDIKTFRDINFKIGDGKYMFSADIHVQHTVGIGLHDDENKDKTYNATDIEIIELNHKSARLGKTTNIFNTVLANDDNIENIKNKLPDFKSTNLTYTQYKDCHTDLIKYIGKMIDIINDENKKNIYRLTVGSSYKKDDILNYINKSYFNDIDIKDQDIEDQAEFSLKDAEENKKKYAIPGLYAQYLLFNNKKRKTIDTAGLNAKIFIIQNIYALALMTRMDVSNLKKMPDVKKVYDLFNDFNNNNKNNGIKTDNMLTFFFRYMVANAAHIVGNTLPFIKVW